MTHVVNLWRHPIKSHGREEIEAVTLIAGQAMPWDRHWAVIHERTKFDAANPEWVMPRSFMIGTLTPGLAGLWAELDTSTKVVTLRHTDLGTLTFAPDDAPDVTRFLDWVMPLCKTDGPRPAGIVSVQDRAMTDTPYASVSIMNRATHGAVAAALGGDLEPERWRGNIWLDDLPAWDEFNWIGRDLRVGDAVLRVRDRIKRCMHTAASPTSGIRDADTLGALRTNWSHQDFGIYAEVIKGGSIAQHDKVEVL